MYCYWPGSVFMYVGGLRCVCARVVCVCGVCARVVCVRVRCVCACGVCERVVCVSCVCVVCVYVVCVCVCVVCVVLVIIFVFGVYWNPGLSDKISDCLLATMAKAQFVVRKVSFFFLFVGAVNERVNFAR